jgi:hypothetical protein
VGAIAVEKKTLTKGANVPVDEEKDNNIDHEYLDIGAF